MPGFVCALRPSGTEVHWCGFVLLLSWQRGALNQLSAFLVLIRDAFDNPRTVNDIASITMKVNNVDVTSSFSYAGTDAYNVTFTPTVAGVLTVRVFVSSVEISGSPFNPVIL
jgi:hypothetical protein